ncbi:uncharacterized protein KY384_005057 [Bacidia gigantensis]|uniref:uncharacterized protein n=1 Tax=Bacidia gigantensis TaxID=2732470 RepID=UPI001D049B02|nr:uncharacterized protein KY384_005057 [Bacidia gigantensis]KAG8530554.1 hypothetical protein KY384_005057 [Bacidia gigantensis]
MKSAFREEDIGQMDESYRVRLPQRDSSQLPEIKEGPVSPASTRLDSPGIESIRSAEATEKEAESPWAEPADKEVYHDPNEPPPPFESLKGPKIAPAGVHPAERRQGKSRKTWIIVGIVAIRSAQLSTAGDWKGGDVTEVVAADAKNGTPIAAAAFARNDTAAWHIFYINNENYITEVVNSNKTNVWSPGPINKLKLQPMSDTHVGLQACWYGSFYSDEDYNHSPVPGQTNKTITDTDQKVGIHLWYATNATNFDSYGWAYGTNTWEQQQSFSPYNGHAGVGCYSWGPGSDTYVIFTDLDNNMNILWKDLNTTLNSTVTHPINEWRDSEFPGFCFVRLLANSLPGNVKIPVFQNTSIGYTNYLYAQNPDLTFSGYNVTWASEDTSVAIDDPDQTFVVSGRKGLPGSHLTVTSLPDKSGGNSLLAFYQTNGSDITEFVRDFDAGQWTSLAVPIPDA